MINLLLLGGILFWQKNDNKRKHVVDENGNLINQKNNYQEIKQYVKPKNIQWRKPLIAAGILVLGIILWLSVDAFAALNKIITKNNGSAAPFLSFLGDIKPDQLKGEGDSRINVLFLGIGGAGHPGGQLTDSIEILSIDPKNKTMAMLSIPRDLRVQIPGNGYGKINEVYSMGENNKAKYTSGPDLTKKTISEMLDLPIHYYARMDFNGFIKFIDAIGGVDVDVAKAIYDPYYPDEQVKGYEPFNLSAGNHHLDGKLALKYARSRETTSDFDRSRRQQQLFVAVREKALSAGVLTNPKKIADIFSTLGEHVRTDLQISEMERLFTLLKDIDTSKINSKVLDSGADSPLTSISDGGYYLVPKTGNYRELQAIAHELFSDTYLTEENAKIEVDNGSDKKGVANDVANMLKSYGYTVTNIDTYKSTIPKTKIIDYSDGKKPFTVQFLKNRFTALVETQPKPNGSNIDVMLIIGQDYEQ